MDNRSTFFINAQKQIFFNGNLQNYIFYTFHYILHLFEEGMWRSVALEHNQDYLSRRIMEASCAVFFIIKMRRKYFSSNVKRFMVRKHYGNLQHNSLT